MWFRRNAGLWIRDRWPLIKSQQNIELVSHGYSYRRAAIQGHDDLPFASAAFQFHAIGHQPRQQAAAATAKRITLPGRCSSLAFPARFSTAHLGLPLSLSGHPQRGRDERAEH